MLWGLGTALRGLAVVAVMAAAAISPVQAQSWKASYQFSPGDSRDDAMQSIARDMAASGLEIKLFPSASLLRPTDQWSALQHGSVDMIFTPADYLMERFPLLGALSLPGAVRSKEHAERLAGSPPMRELQRQFEAAGVIILTDTWLPGAFATRTKCVVAPADVQGLRARTIGKYMSEVWTAAGAIPVPATTSEALPVLVNSGLIDIANTSISTLLALKMEKKFTCLTLPGDQGALWYLYETVLVSKARFDALSEPQRQALIAAAQKAQAELKTAASLSLRRLAGRYLAAGVEVVTLDGEALADWHRLARRTAWKLFREQVPGGGDFLDRLQAVE